MVMGNKGRGRPKKRLSDNVQEFSGPTMLEAEKKGARLTNKQFLNDN